MRSKQKPRNHAGLRALGLMNAVRVILPYKSQSKKQLVFPQKRVYNSNRNKYRGACRCRLRGSNRTSTLSPDADNAAVGSHMDFLQEASKEAASCFYFTISYAGSLYDRLRGRYDLRPIYLIWIMPT